MIDTKMKPIAVQSHVAAEYLGISVKTLANLRLAGIGPKYAKLHDGPRAGVLYRVDDLDAWLEERLVSRRR